MLVTLRTCLHHGKNLLNSVLVECPERFLVVGKVESGAPKKLKVVDNLQIGENNSVVVVVVSSDATSKALDDGRLRNRM